MGMQLVRPQRAVVARRPSPAQRKAVRSIASVESASRREAGAGVLAGAAALAPPAGADGVLGIGGKNKSKKYYDETYDVINQVEYTISLDKDDPSKVRQYIRLTQLRSEKGGCRHARAYCVSVLHESLSRWLT